MDSVTAPLCRSAPPPRRPRSGRRPTTPPRAGRLAPPGTGQVRAVRPATAPPSPRQTHTRRPPLPPSRGPYPNRGPPHRPVRAGLAPDTRRPPRRVRAAAPIRRVRAGCGPDPHPAPADHPAACGPDPHRTPRPHRRVRAGCGPDRTGRPPTPPPGAGRARPVRTLGSAARSVHSTAVTVPAPTVRPPSRMAKPSPGSRGISRPSSTVIVTVSPGRATAASPRSTSPTTSAVRM